MRQGQVLRPVSQKSVRADRRGSYFDNQLEMPDLFVTRVPLGLFARFFLFIFKQTLLLTKESKTTQAKGSATARFARRTEGNRLPESWHRWRSPEGTLA